MLWLGSQGLEPQRADSEEESHLECCLHGYLLLARTFSCAVRVSLSSLPAVVEIVKFAKFIGYLSPASRARMIAWVRSATCNLLKIFDTWLRTVLVLSTSRSAISWFVNL